MKHAKLLLQKLPHAATDFVFFTNEKVFSVASPDSRQNDCVYAPRDTRKRSTVAEHLLHCRPTLSKSLMVSVAVSKLGYSFFFVEPGVKVDGRYYRDVLLKQQMLPVMRRIAGDTYVFHQDSAPAKRARDTVQLLQQETPEFIALDLWLPNSPDLNPVNYHVWGLMQERVYKTAVRDTADLKRHLTETWLSIPQTVIDEAIDEWGYDYETASKQRDITSSTHWRCSKPALFRATKHYHTTTGSCQSHPHFIEEIGYAFVFLNISNIL